MLERGGSQHRQRWRSRDHKVETIHSQPDFSGSHDLLVSHTVCVPVDCIYFQDMLDASYVFNPLDCFYGPIALKSGIEVETVVVKIS